jgi:hypothetical protein
MIEWPLLAVEEQVLAIYGGHSGGSGAYHHHEKYRMFKYHIFPSREPSPQQIL